MNIHYLKTKPMSKWKITVSAKKGPHNKHELAFQLKKAIATCHNFIPRASGVVCGTTPPTAHSANNKATNGPLSCLRECLSELTPSVR